MPARSASQGLKSAACHLTEWQKLGIGLVPEGRQIFSETSLCGKNLGCGLPPTGSMRRNPWTLGKDPTRLFPAARRARLQHGQHAVPAARQQMLAIGPPRADDQSKNF